MIPRYLCPACQDTADPATLRLAEKGHGSCSGCGGHAPVLVGWEPGDNLDWMTKDLPQTSGSMTQEYGGAAVGLAPGIDY